MRKLTTEQFITRAKEIHGDLYDYSQTVYTHSGTKIKILCKHHGEFFQLPTNHCARYGCPLCANEKVQEKYSKIREEFATKANLVHNNKYDYSLVDYKLSNNKVKIICKSHGEFLQTPSNHLQGNGCPVCANECKGWTRTKFKDHCTKNNNGLGILYILECFNTTERFFKIGITSRSVKERYPNKTTMPYAYSVVKEIVGDGAYIYDLEKELHKEHKVYKYTPEIYFEGNTECFSTLVTKGSSLSF